MFAVRRKLGLGSGMVLALSFSLLLAAAPADSPVADAAQRGDVQAVRSLLQQGADPNAAQSDGLTAMHWAAQRGDVEILEALLYAGATLEPLTRLGSYTPLHLASRSGHGDFVRTILEAGSKPDVFTSTGVTAMHFASQANSPGAIVALVDHGADIDAADKFSDRTPLMFASVRNATDAMQALVNAHADLSLTTAVKDFVEISEASSDDRARRERIRNAAAAPDPDAARGGGQGAGRGRGGPTPPDSADVEEEEEMTDPAADTFPEVVALSSQEQIGKQGGFTALHFAAREGHREATALLLEAGADIDQVTAGDESSPLLVAVVNGNYDLARDLLEAGADPNLVSDDGAGPLFATLNIEWSLRTWYPQPQMFRSQEMTYLDLMEALLEAGAEPNQRTTTHIWYAAYNAGRMGVDFTGATPFWRAAYAADVNAMRLLHSYGADPDLWTYNLPARQRFGGPPQDDDEEEEDPSGLPPVPVGGRAVHPLHAAAGVGHGTSRVAQQHRHVPDGWLPAVRYLVEEIGVDPNIRDYAGYAPAHHAAARGDNETILYLVSQGADVTLLARSGQTTADMANSPEQRAQPHPATIALLEKLGSKNNHNCRSCGQGGEN